MRITYFIIQIEKDLIFLLFAFGVITALTTVQASNHRASEEYLKKNSTTNTSFALEAGPGDEDEPNEKKKLPNQSREKSTRDLISKFEQIQKSAQRNFKDFSSLGPVQKATTELEQTQTNSKNNSPQSPVQKAITKFEQIQKSVKGNSRNVFSQSQVRKAIAKFQRSRNTHQNRQPPKISKNKVDGLTSDFEGAEASSKSNKNNRVSNSNVLNLISKFEESSKPFSSNSDNISHNTEDNNSISKSQSITNSSQSNPEILFWKNKVKDLVLQYQNPMATSKIITDKISLSRNVRDSIFKFEENKESEINPKIDDFKINSISLALEKIYQDINEFPNLNDGPSTLILPIFFGPEKNIFEKLKKHSNMTEKDLKEEINSNPCSFDFFPGKDLAAEIENNWRNQMKDSCCLECLCENDTSNSNKNIWEKCLNFEENFLKTDEIQNFLKNGKDFYNFVGTQFGCSFFENIKMLIFKTREIIESGESNDPKSPCSQLLTIPFALMNNNILISCSDFNNNYIFLLKFVLISIICDSEIQEIEKYSSFFFLLTPDRSTIDILDSINMNFQRLFEICQILKRIENPDLIGFKTAIKRFLLNKIYDEKFKNASYDEISSRYDPDYIKDKFSQYNHASIQDETSSQSKPASSKECEFDFMEILKFVDWKLRNGLLKSQKDWKEFKSKFKSLKLQKFSLFYKDKIQIILKNIVCEIYEYKNDILKEFLNLLNDMIGISSHSIISSIALFMNKKLEIICPKKEKYVDISFIVSLLDIFRKNFENSLVKEMNTMSNLMKMLSITSNLIVLDRLEILNSQLYDPSSIINTHCWLLKKAISRLQYFENYQVNENSKKYRIMS